MINTDNYNAMQNTEILLKLELNTNYSIKLPFNNNNDCS
jgi:hypothetical protein